jgi:hypothetical protein
MARLSQITWVFFSHSLKLLAQVNQNIVIGISVPRTNMDSVLFLKLEVFVQVVNQNDPRQISSHSREILDQLLPHSHRVLPI